MAYTTIEILGLRAVKKHVIDKNTTLKSYINGLIASDIAENAKEEVQEEYDEERDN